MNSDQTYNLLLKMRYTSSRNDKLEILRDVPSIFLKFAYHPHWTYQFSDTSSVAMMRGLGTNTINMKHIQLLCDLKNRKITGNKALYAVGNVMKDLSYWSAELFKCILFKDFKCGISTKAILSLHPFLFPSEFCMKAQDYDPALVTLPALISEKIDGIRGMIRGYQMQSSTGRQLLGLHHILEEFDKRRLLGPFVWDGEITVPGMDFDTASGLIRSNKTVYAARFNVFDVPSYQNPDLRERLKYIKDHLGGMVFTRIVDHEIVESFKEINTWTDHYFAEGYEGAMVKNINCPYEYERSFNWLKRKRVETKDLKVVGLVAGKGKFSGKVGSLLLEDGSHCGSGMTDVQRQMWYDDPSLIVQHTVEVEYMEKSKKGKQRHPRLIRVRLDKE